MISADDFRADHNTWAYWSRCGKWSVNEAGCLIAGIDPSKVGEAFGEWVYPDIAEKVQRVLKDELECVGQDRFPPARFLEVADLLKLNVSPILRERVVEMDERRRADRANSQADDDDQKSSGSDDLEPENPRRTKTLLKMIAAVAYDAYGWRPGVRGSTASEIASATQRIGSSVSDDTIRSILEEASEFVEPETENDA